MLLSMSHSQQNRTVESPSVGLPQKIRLVFGSERRRFGCVYPYNATYGCRNYDEFAGQGASLLTVGHLCSRTSLNGIWPDNELVLEAREIIPSSGCRIPFSTNPF